jgi:hypothetical protein
MKSTRPQGYRFSWRSHRSGRQTQKRRDLFNPFSIPSTSELRRVTALCLFARPRFVSVFFRCSLVRISMSLKRRLKMAKVPNKRLVSKNLIPLDT